MESEPLTGWRLVTVWVLIAVVPWFLVIGLGFLALRYL
jgi:hypothetical protein